MKLLKVVPSTNTAKRYDAFFDDGRKTSFGSSDYESYIDHHDKHRRELYRARHTKDLRTGDPTRAGYLAFHILWGEHTSLKKNIEDYKKKFGF